ncbi:MAG: metallophosphoesterase [Verrucomicrobiota bacterium]
MKILVVSDLHYRLKQFDWLVQNAESYDLIVIAGDLMELGSYVDPDIQASVVEQYFRKICAQTPLVACSGNHDLVDEGDGTRTTEWLQDMLIPNLTVDQSCHEGERIRVLAFPWWQNLAQRDEVARWLEHQYIPNDYRVTLWAHHAPPQGSKTSWNGKKHLGDPTIVEWINKYQPEFVLSGHIHNAPYHADGSWIDRIGETVVINGGRKTGEVPATITIELESQTLVWRGLEGSEHASFA